MSNDPFLVQSQSFDEIVAYLAEQMQRLTLPGAVLAIVEGDNLVHLRGFGLARPGGECPTGQTPFFIGSLTKSFTALAVMQQVEAGKVELDAPVQRYLPWFRVAGTEASTRMTVRHLLNQTSGLPVLPGMTNLGDFDSRPGAAERQMRALSTFVPARLPGDAFEYSNLNYVLLGLVLEAASGENYADYIQRHIFDPLQMRRSYTSKTAAQRDGLAVGYRYWFGIPIAAPGLPVPSAELAAGQLISCAEDMARYLAVHLNDGRCGGVQILSEVGMRELHTGAAEIFEMGRSFGSYAMGWISHGTGESKIVSHSGIVPDFGTFMALLPTQKRGMVLLFNANHGAMKMTFDELGLSTAERLAGLSPTPHQFDAVPWLMRALPLIPVLQIAGIAATLLRLNGWRREPALRPGRGRLWWQHILLPLVPNLSFAAALGMLISSGFHRFARVFMPDVYWITLIGGGFAGLWAAVRTALMLRAARRRP